MAQPRRRFLAGLLACPACAAGAAAQAPHWSYGGEAGPEAWGRLDPANSACSVGAQQSPVDLVHAIRAELPALALRWKPQAFAVVNNGHSIQLDAAPGSLAELSGPGFELLQFHFHTPSEHTVDGKPAAMEAHFVHKGPDGRLGVLGVLMQAGAPNAAFAAIMQVAPAAPGSVPLAAPINPLALLPARKQSVWRYEGSLTTPPCSETVDWIVLRSPITVAAADIEKFQAIVHHNNARPVQPLNRRFLLRS